jgi:dTMP kinase
MKLNNKSGLFIVFEGIDGSGKNYHINKLSEKFNARGQEVIITSEPWISDEGKLLRNLAFEGRKGLSPEKEAELYLLDRIKHTIELIKPALSSGKVVICSRYYYSTMAYQGALGENPESIRAANESKVPIPDLVIMLKLGVRDALKRIDNRNEKIAIAYEDEIYLEKVSEILYNIKAPYIHIIDSSGSMEQTEKLIDNLVEQFLSNQKHF